MDNKKIAAATAAVFTYIKTQEETAYYAANAEIEEKGDITAMAMEPDRQSQFSAWANAGRLNQMQHNTAILMRVK